MSSEVIVTSRECPLCGHHEIGYIKQDGVFHPLKPGARIQTLEGPQGAEEISRKTYGAAYLEKLQQLIEEEIHTFVAILLDRYFASPHLATGNSRQIAGALGQELDEINNPVEWVEGWLEKRDGESVKKMIYPLSEEGLVDPPVSEEEQRKELEDLSLQEFLELL
jgi:hypothetical protein